MPILKQILEFAETRRLWERDLLRRICSSDQLTQRDLQDAYELLKAETGLPTTIAGEGAKPLTRFHIAPDRTPTSITRLLRIVNAANVNRLAPGQSLAFAT